MSLQRLTCSRIPPRAKNIHPPLTQHARHPLNLSPMAPRDMTPQTPGFLRSFWTEPDRFNRACGVAALAWMIGLAVFVSLRPPNYHDFGQYYMAGLIARHGLWGDLYPIPHPASNANAGGRADSDMRPAYARLAEEHGVGDVNRFIQTPPIALLLIPLSFLSCHAAYVLWVCVMSACCWGLSVQAGRIYQLLHGQPDRLPGLLALLIVASPLVYRTVRTAQVSPAIALAMGWATIAMVHHRHRQAAAAILAGSLIKYAAGILLILAMARHRWRILQYFTLLAIPTLLITLSITGTEPFQIFANEIAPTLSRTHPWRGNQSLSGWLIHAAPQLDLTTVGLASRVAGAGALALVAGLAWVRHRAQPESPSSATTAACLALTACWPIASPIFWEHYYVYFIPFWGYLAWEARSGKWKTTAVTFAIAATWFPLAVVANLQLPVWLRFHMFVGACVMLAVGVARLSGVLGNNDQHPAGPTNPQTAS